MAIVEVTVVDGTILEVQTASPDPTLQEVCDRLIEQHSFTRGVRLMYGGAMQPPTRRASEFPAAGLIAVGSREGKRPATSQRSPQGLHSGKSPAGARSPGLSPGRKSNVPSPSGARGSHAHQQRQQQQQRRDSRTASVSPARRPQPQEPITVTTLISDTGVQHSIVLHQASTVADLMTHLVAKEPALHGCRFLFHGHIVDDNTQELRHYGITDGSTVHVVHRNTDPQLQKLIDAENTVGEQEKILEKDKSEQTRKGLYEQSMRLLFSLDGLELDGESRLRRKALVKRIQTLQDHLGVAENNN